jgi:hypothetical protein
MNKHFILKLGKQKELKLFLLPVFFFLLVLTSFNLPVAAVAAFFAYIIDAKLSGEINL